MTDHNDWQLTQKLPDDMQQWLDEQTAKQKAAKEAEQKALNEKPRRPMTSEEYWKLQELANCTFRIGSYNKRFVRNLSSLPEGSEITERQGRNIHRLFYRYRRQHGHPVTKPEE